MVLPYIKNSKKSEDSKGSSLSPDVPIEDEEEDKLNLKEFVDSIVKSINNYNQKNSITFGLFGDWGSGKTSLTNCIKHKLKNNERYIIIDFIPWQYNDRDNMLKEFYYKISKELNSIYAYLKIKKYALKSIDIKYLSIDLLNLNNDLESIQKDINNYLHTLENKKIIIFIDDLDRLKGVELLDFFKMIKSNFSIANIIYFLSFDYNTVKEQLKKEGFDEKYLEKIIQVPIKVPEYDNIILEKFLEDEFKTFFGNSILNIPEFNIYSFYECATKLLKNLRNIKRYLNEIKVLYQLVSNKVNVYDFCVIELIRIIDLELYYFISKNSDKILKLDKNNRFSKIYEDTYNKKINQDLEKLIDSIFDPYYIVNKKQSIFSSEYFDNYFIYNRYTNQILEEDIESILNLINNSDEKAKEKLNEILNENNILSFINKFEQEQDVKIINKDKIKKFTQDFIDVVESFLYKLTPELQYRLSSFIIKIIERLDEKERVEYIKKLIDQSFDDLSLILFIVYLIARLEYKISIKEYLTHDTDEKTTFNRNEFNEIKNYFMSQFEDKYMKSDKNIFDEIKNDNYINVLIWNLLNDFSNLSIRINNEVSRYIISKLNSEENILRFFEIYFSSKTYQFMKDNYRINIFLFNHIQKIISILNKFEFKNDQKELKEIYINTAKECLIEQTICDYIYEQKIKNLESEVKFNHEEILNIFNSKYTNLFAMSKEELINILKILQREYIIDNYSFTNKIHPNIFIRSSHWDEIKSIINEILEKIKKLNIQDLQKRTVDIDTYISKDVEEKNKYKLIRSVFFNDYIWDKIIKIEIKDLSIVDILKQNISQNHYS